MTSYSPSSRSRTASSVLPAPDITNLLARRGVPGGATLCHAGGALDHLSDHLAALAGQVHERAQRSAGDPGVAEQGEQGHLVSDRLCFLVFTEVADRHLEEGRQRRERLQCRVVAAAGAQLVPASGGSRSAGGSSPRAPASCSRGAWSWVSRVRIPSLTPLEVQVRSPRDDPGRGLRLSGARFWEPPGSGLRPRTGYRRARMAIRSGARTAGTRRAGSVASALPSRTIVRDGRSGWPDEQER